MALAPAYAGASTDPPHPYCNCDCHKPSAATRHHFAGRPLLLSAPQNRGVRSILNRRAIAPPAAATAILRGGNAVKMAARIGGEHGSKNSHEIPRSAHRTVQDTRVLSVGGIVVWFLVKRACYRSRRGFSTVAAPPIKLVVPFILESVPSSGSAENGSSVYRSLNRLSIHPDSSPFAVHQCPTLGKGSLQHRALRSHPGPDPLSQVPARIRVRH